MSGCCGSARIQNAGGSSSIEAENATAVGVASSAAARTNRAVTTPVNERREARLRPSTPDATTKTRCTTMDPALLQHCRAIPKPSPSHGRPTQCGSSKEGQPMSARQQFGLRRNETKRGSPRRGNGHPSALTSVDTDFKTRKRPAGPFAARAGEQQRNPDCTSRGRHRRDQRERCP
jgi:hypothetical protein